MSTTAGWPPKPTTVREQFSWAYANFAGVSATWEEGNGRDRRDRWRIRKSLYYRLIDGTAHIGFLIRDERSRTTEAVACSYCGSQDRLTVDHLIPRARLGEDLAHNIVWACTSCNSSKGAKDVLEWLQEKGQFPTLVVLRRYLQLVALICDERGCLDEPFPVSNLDLPFDLERLPTVNYPPIRELQRTMATVAGWPPQPTTVREQVAWAYANFAGVRATWEDGNGRDRRTRWSIRKSLYYRLLDGRARIGSLIRDERSKMTDAVACSYCGSTDRLTVDHLIPRAKLGEDLAHNIVWACTSCNSSKGAKDMLEWHQEKGQFPTLVVLRRYLKLVARICDQRGCLDDPFPEPNLDLPFDLERLPTVHYPPIREIRLTASPTLGSPPFGQGVPTRTS